MPVRRSKREPCSQHSMRAVLDLALGERDGGVGADVLDREDLVAVARDRRRPGRRRRRRAASSSGTSASAQARCEASSGRPAGRSWPARPRPSRRARSSISGTPILRIRSLKKPCTTRRRASSSGDAARAQVEQLLVVEAAGRRGVAGALDLAGLDLEVGHRVGLAAVGEHEVAVLLVGLDALGLLADQHVADPDRVGALALQRALVGRRGSWSSARCGRRRAGARCAGRRRRSRGRASRPRRRGRRTSRWRRGGPRRRRR